jgi:hypothetical protein
VQVPLQLFDPGLGDFLTVSAAYFDLHAVVVLADTLRSRDHGPRGCHDGWVRSVFAFPSRPQAEVSAVLGQLAIRSVVADGSVEWIVDEALWIRVIRRSDLASQWWLEWEPQVQEALRASMGQVPVWGLQIDISSRVGGHREVLNVLAAVLSPGGQAVDDSANRTWSMAELFADGAREFMRAAAP